MLALIVVLLKGSETVCICTDATIKTAMQLWGRTHGIA